MDILVIGNGFDLAHGLQTKYADFLEQLKEIIKIGKLINLSNKKYYGSYDKENYELEKPNFDLVNNKKSEKYAIRFNDNIKEYIDCGVYDNISDYLEYRDYYDEERQRDILNENHELKNWILKINKNFDFN